MQALRPVLFSFFLASVIAAQTTAPPPPTATPQLKAVTIYRDTDSWAHIFSGSDAAAYYGFGLAQMRDLPLTTARNLALASGELALHVGPGPVSGSGLPFHVKVDLRSRIWRVQETAVKQALTLPNDIRLLLRAYVAGVNAGRIEWLANASQLAFNTEPLSYDLTTVQRLLSRPVTVSDVLCHGVQMNGLTAMSVADDLAQSDDPNVSESRIRKASNSFAIGREASLEGAAMTIADPHLGFQDIGQLRAYFAQISGGTNDVCGISFPGFPTIAMGFNADLSWAITSNNPDTIDVWKAKSTAGSASFIFDGQPVLIIREQVTIGVWDPATGLVTNQNHTRSYAGSRDRPILREAQSGSTISPTNAMGTIWYAGSTFATDQSLWEFFIRLGQSKTVAKAKTAFGMNVILGNNFLIADKNGTLGYLWSGRVPQRGAPTPGTDWSMIQDGSSSSYQWLGVHSAAELPWEQLSYGEGPGVDESKWLQCNVRADLVRPGTDLNLAKYPEYMVHPNSTPLSWRQVRGREMLTSGEPVSAAQLRAMAIDDLDVWWRAVEPLALEVMNEFALWQYPDLVDSFIMLDEWNGSTAPDRAEPLISHLVWACYAEMMDDLKQAGQPAGSYADFRNPEDLPDLATFKSSAWFINRRSMAASLMRADGIWRNCINPVMTQLSFPSSPWTPTPFQHLPASQAVWGTAHYVDITPFSSPLDVAAYPVAGSISMLALGNTRISEPWETILENVTVLWQTGTLVNLPIDSGAHTLLQVTLHSSGPEAWFLEAIGPSELGDDPDRYRYSQDFVDGRWRRFHTKSANLSTNAISSQNLMFDLNSILSP